MTAKIFNYKTGKEIKAVESKCSFCGKRESETKRMISNTQDKFICDQCVLKFKAIFNANTENESA